MTHPPITDHTPTPIPWAELPPGVQAIYLRAAIDEMASRYGLSTRRVGYALWRDEAARDRHTRAADRQYRALLRLTRALADMVPMGGGR